VGADLALSMEVEDLDQLDPLPRWGMLIAQSQGSGPKRKGSVPLASRRLPPVGPGDCGRERHRLLGTDEERDSRLLHNPEPGSRLCYRRRNEARDQSGAARSDVIDIDTARGAGCLVSPFARPLNPDLPARLLPAATMRSSHSLSLGDVADCCDVRITRDWLGARHLPE
jgi:hypothetical protein